MKAVQLRLDQNVHCRTGSLEIAQQSLRAAVEVHCRTGSLVIVAVTGAETGPSKPKREAA